MRETGPDAPPAAGHRRLPPFAALLVLGLALAQLVLHLATSGRFGIFRDELYYLACADHMAYGYVDHPPLSISILAAARWLLGDSLWAIRLPAALAGAALVVFAGCLARELGGRRFAQGLAALCATIAPIVLILGSFHSMNAFELGFWLLGAWILARILRTGDMQLWALLGLVIGLGMLNKVSMGVFALALTGGLLLTRHRRLLLRPRFWMAPVIALLMFLPHLLWQVAEGWPTLEFVANAQREKIVATAPWAFVAENALEAHPASLLVWLGGLIWLFAGAAGRYRPLGWIFLLSLAIMLLQRTKPYYMAPAYLILIAAGGVAVERFLAERWRPWAKPVLVGLLVLGGFFTLPLALPLLSPGATASYLDASGLHPNTGEDHGESALPQYFSDRFAWREQADAVARAFAALTPGERAGCVILCENYGEAGAIDYFGRERGLPRPHCGHNSYYLWWDDDAIGETAIAIGHSLEGLRRMYERVDLVERLDVPFARRGEATASVFVCREPKAPLAEIKPYLRNFI